MNFGLNRSSYKTELEYFTALVEKRMTLQTCKECQHLNWSLHNISCTLPVINTEQCLLLTSLLME